MSPNDFFFQDYRMKVDYLVLQFGRMWIRFNFFLTIESGIFGFLSYLLFKRENSNIEAAIIPIALGIAVSFLWYIVGAQDRALVEGYRQDMRDAAERIAGKWPEELGWCKNEYVGSRFKDRTGNFIRNGPFSWYWDNTSITTLAAIIPVLVFAVWIGLW